MSLRANGQILASLVQRIRAAESVDDCFRMLADSRAYAGFKLVGFRDGQLPAVARMRHAQLWTRRFGWPPGFLREWLRLNLAVLNPPSPQTTVDRISHWQLPPPESLELDDSYDEQQRARINFLRKHGVESGIIVAVRRSHGETGFVSWLRPNECRRPELAMKDPGLPLLADMFFEAMDRLRPADTSELLSRRELQCLTWAAYGLTDKEIAAELSCSHDTVRFHVKNILRKLAASNRTHAVAVAVQSGLVALGGSPSATRQNADRSAPQ